MLLLHHEKFPTCDRVLHIIIFFCMISMNLFQIKLSLKYFGCIFLVANMRHTRIIIIT